MDRTSLYAALAAALLLIACDRTRAPDDAANAMPDNAAPAADLAPVGPPPEATPPPEAPPHDAAAPALTPQAERGETGARAILLDFVRAIELKRFGQAWALLSPADRRKWSEAQFAGLFADLGTITVAAPTGTLEGAAGSSYYTAPVTITANDRDGRPVRIAGEAVLRRVNDVPGADAAQLRWHFERLTLDWTH